MKKLPPKTMDEAVDRLRAGERFECEDWIIRYDSSSIGSPFRADGDELKAFWLNLEDWQPIQEWHETVSPENPRLCWVWDDAACHSGKVFAVKIIRRVVSRGYENGNGTIWKFATPVTPEDLTGN